MNIACTLCGKKLDTAKDDVNVTTEWIFKDLLAANSVEYSSAIPRVVKVCSHCWDGTLNSPEAKTISWKFNTSI